MTSKEKATSLYNQFYGIPLYIKTVKQCVIISVNEILETIPKNNGWQTSIEYWEEVKKEIENL